MTAAFHAFMTIMRCSLS